MKKITTISATLSGNRGAEGMLRAMIENIRALEPDVYFNVLSVYPHDDVNENDYSSVEIVDGRPKVFMIRSFMEAFIYKFITKKFVKRYCRASKAILESDLVLDLSGVSFVDGRGLPLLIYNLQCVLIPKWYNVPIMKVSQAMGSFNGILNKMAARYALKKVDLIAARGLVTSAHLDSIKIKHEYCTDAAFSLETKGSLPDKVISVFGSLRKNEKKIIGLCPSVVVKEYCDNHKMDYKVIMTEFVKRLTDKGYSVVMFSHSARKFTSKSKNNDLPLCREIYQKANNLKDFHFIDDILNAVELRLLIGQCDYFIGSRFHSVISALCVKVPFFLIGWSHKYAEVLDAFQIPEMALDFKDLKVKKLMEKFDELIEEEDRIRNLIESNLEGVVNLSGKNSELAIRLLEAKNETE